ncbi:cAMP-binding proteins - catabolite gene activator and regulatory subunit of cAMP-dependent protein kinases [Candidatus Scalindua japonica]|uniref:cAMP-binding proteins-catabolite gene activator and regulatory subunit of cAMP-dependent protein kinases n=1 Tax=Candidatus Scalindua japonica TaxID=1284222 RepID=A0A286TTF7_9BACT|nr:cyclic nucleotide-binding domain-containing protein [Candidatus Scalindua japonica]GAX59167.1 cAMP-binding proteins - catabolite gene activator and regulatory subunit of cAMP-dependent protein kinases [Candidatus Scalindua japonica]
MQLKQYFKKKRGKLQQNVPEEFSSPEPDSGSGEAIEIVVKSLDIFQRLNKKQIKVLSSLLIRRTCSKGEIIIKKGSIGLGMFIITSGQMEVYEERHTANVRLAIIKANECVGEMSLVDEQPRSANVKALDDCEYLLLTRDSFNGLVKREPEILWGIVPIIVKRLQKSSRMVVDLSQTTNSDQSYTINSTSYGNTGNNNEPEVENHKPHELTQKTEDSFKEGKETVTEDVPDEKEDDLFSSIMQLSAASLMSFSTIHLLGVQEMFRLAIGKGPMKERISKSEEIVSSATTSLKENMSGKNQKLFDSFWDFMDSLTSIFKL